jgi:enolase
MPVLKRPRLLGKWSPRNKGDRHARQILDSRPHPTLEVDVALASGARGRASVPAGSSTGRYEALELRDGGDARHGRAVQLAIVSVHDRIAPQLIGVDVPDQDRVDATLVELGGSSRGACRPTNRLAIESSCWVRSARRHSGNRCASGSITSSASCCSRGGCPAVGDEGGHAARLGSTEEALDLCWTRPWRLVTSPVPTSRSRSMPRPASSRMTGYDLGGDTEDATIADLAVGTGCPFVKAGAPVHACKYNRRLRIEEELGADAPFASSELPASAFTGSA